MEHHRVNPLPYITKLNSMSKHCQKSHSMKIIQSEEEYFVTNNRCMIIYLSYPINTFNCSWCCAIGGTSVTIGGVGFSANTRVLVGSDGDCEVMSFTDVEVVCVMPFMVGISNQ